MSLRVRTAVALLLFSAPATAYAQQSTHELLRTLVDELNATPEWSARFDTLTFNAQTDTATMKGFAAATTTGDAEVVFEEVVVSGLTRAADGTIAAQSAVFDGVNIEAGFSTIVMPRLTVAELKVPALEPIVWIEDQPFTSLMRIYREGARIELATATASALDVTQTLEGLETEVSYGTLRIDGVADRKIASMTAGPLNLVAPSDEGIITMTLGGFEAKNMDFGAFVDVYDPDAYVNGQGDMVWHNALEYAAYTDIVMNMPGGRVRFDSVVAEDFGVRQPRQSFAPFMDAIMANPDMPEEQAEELALRFLPGLLGAWSFGSMSLNGMIVDAEGIDRFAIGQFLLRDTSIDGLGEFAIENMEISIPGQFAMRLDRFSLGDMVFGGMEGFERLMATIARDEDPDPATLIPVIGGMELLDLAVQFPLYDIATGRTELQTISLDHMDAETSNYVSGLPTRSRFEMGNLVVPAKSIPEPAFQAFMNRFGYEEIDVSISGATDWDSARETFSISDYIISFAGMGSIAFDGTFGGIPLDAAVAMTWPEDGNATLVDASLTFKDDSIVGAGLELLAEQLGFSVPVEVFRTQVAAAMPFLLSIGTASDPELKALIQRSGLLPQLTPAIKDFVAAEGGAITFSMKPGSAVPLDEIGRTAESQPENLAELLGLSISAVPGQMPEPEPAPAPEPAPQEPAEQQAPIQPDAN